MDTFLIIGLVILVLLIVYVFITYNKLIKNNNRVKEAFSTMDVYLKKRWDLIPNIVDTVKGYAKHEQTTFIDTIKARSLEYDKMSTNDKIDSNIKINEDINRLMAVVENYPDLKASDNFLSLSKELSKVEDEIAKSRKYYNATVRYYNNIVEMFPSNIVSKILGFKSKKMFETNSEEKENIKIEM